MRATWRPYALPAILAAGLLITAPAGADAGRVVASGADAAGTNADHDSGLAPDRAPLRVAWFHTRVAADGGMTVSGLVRRIRVRPGPVAGVIRVVVAHADGSGAAVLCLASRDLRPAGSRGGTFSVHFTGRDRTDQVAVRYARDCA